MLFLVCPFYSTTKSPVQQTVVTRSIQDMKTTNPELYLRNKWNQSEDNPEYVKPDQYPSYDEPPGQWNQTIPSNHLLYGNEIGPGTSYFPESASVDLHDNSGARLVSNTPHSASQGPSEDGSAVSDALHQMDTNNSYSDPGRWDDPTTPKGSNTLLAPMGSSERSTMLNLSSEVDHRQGHFDNRRNDSAPSFDPYFEPSQHRQTQYRSSSAQSTASSTCSPAPAGTETSYPASHIVSGYSNRNEATHPNTQERMNASSVMNVDGIGYGQGQLGYGPSHFPSNMQPTSLAQSQAQPVEPQNQLSQAALQENGQPTLRDYRMEDAHSGPTVHNFTGTNEIWNGEYATNRGPAPLQVGDHQRQNSTSSMHENQRFSRPAYRPITHQRDITMHAPHSFTPREPTQISVTVDEPDKRVYQRQHQENWQRMPVEKRAVNPNQSAPYNLQQRATHSIVPLPRQGSRPIHEDERDPAKRGRHIPYFSERSLNSYLEQDQPIHSSRRDQESTYGQASHALELQHAVPIVNRKSVDPHRPLHVYQGTGLDRRHRMDTDTDPNTDALNHATSGRSISPNYPIGFSNSQPNSASEWTCKPFGSLLRNLPNPPSERLTVEFMQLRIGTVPQQSYRPPSDFEKKDKLPKGAPEVIPFSGVMEPSEYRIVVENGVQKAFFHIADLGRKYMEARRRIGEDEFRIVPDSDDWGEHAPFAVNF